MYGRDRATRIGVEHMNKAVEVMAEEGENIFLVGYDKKYLVIILSIRLSIFPHVFKIKM